MTNRKRQNDANEYSVVVLELDDATPRLNPIKPNLFVATTLQTPEEKFTHMSQGKGKRGKWAMNRIIRLRPDLALQETFKSHMTAKKQKNLLIKNLRNQGFTVNNQTKTWSIYVVELSNQETFENWVYVGSTSKTAEDRFQEHIEARRNAKGPLFSRTVNKFGKQLLPELFPEENKFFTQEQAQQAEKEHASKLQDEGYKVHYG